MGAYLLKQSLRANPVSYNSYSPQGWSPRLRVVVMGPTPPSAELVWQVQKPDGSDWFEHRADVPELEEEQTSTLELQKWDEGTDIDAAGECAITLSLVSELDGVDQLLHNGVLAAKKVGATVFEDGDVGSYMYEASLFKDGKRLQKASYLSGGWGFSDNHGQTVAQEIIAEFEAARGWNNIEDWNEHWHRFDQNPGHYEVKFLKEKKVARTVGFDVEDGRHHQDRADRARRGGPSGPAAHRQEARQERLLRRRRDRRHRVVERRHVLVLERPDGGRRV